MISNVTINQPHLIGTPPVNKQMKDEPGMPGYPHGVTPTQLTAVGK